jgi:phage protein D
MSNPFVIRNSFRTAKLAQDACNAKWANLQRSTSNIELDLIQGNPLIIPESPLQLGEAFPPEMVDQSLIINRCNHDISSSGYKMSVNAEKQS